MTGRSDFLLQALLVAAANIAFVVPIDIAWTQLTVPHTDVVESDASDAEVDAAADGAHATRDA